MPDPDPPEDVNEWTVAGRYVAIFEKMADVECPKATEPSSWLVESLFNSDEAQKLMNGKKLPAPLERFCRYTWLGEAPPTAVPVPEWEGNYRIDPDRDVLMPQTTYLGGDPATRDELAAAFRKHSGTLGSGAATQVYKQTAAAARVAVIDSVGFADAGLEYASASSWYWHGLAMAELVHTVRCPNDEENCGDPQFHAQAFPYVGTSPQAQAGGGGPLGSIGSLAYALGEAVIRWKELPPLDPPLMKAPLILNLSVAWDPAYGDADLTDPGQEAQHTVLLEPPLNTEVPANVQAVHAVLVYAACLDALTIAASGNNTGAPCEQTGAMAPALWERYPTPDVDRCEALFGQLPDRRPGDMGVAAATSSLVYAAGGVTAYGQPIPVARPDSTPPRVVLAFQAVVGAGARQTDAWTGTSVAAAALSGLAASIWTHHPVLTPSQVIGLITRSGDLTDLPVATSATGEAKLITGYDAFAKLCDERSDNAVCTNPYVEADPPEQTSPEIGASNMMSADLQCTATATSCGDAAVTMHGCTDTAATLPAFVPAPSPWLRPQPDIPYCPYCPIKGGKLTLSLNPDHAINTTMLNNPTLEFRLADGSYVRAGLGQISVDEVVDLATYDITIDGETQSIAAVLNTSNVTAATLGFYLGDSTSVSTRATSAVSVTWDAESSSPGDETTGGHEYETTDGDDSTGSGWDTTSMGSEYDSTGLGWSTSDGSGYDSTGLEWGTTSGGSGDDSTSPGGSTTSDSSGSDDTGTENTTSTGTSG